MRSSCNSGADYNLWGAEQVITLLWDVLPDQLAGAHALAWSTGGNTSLSGFSQDGRWVEQMPVGQGPEETREGQG